MLLGNGDGSFAAATHLAVPAVQHYDIAIGNLDGIGAADIAVSNYSSSISVLLNHDTSLSAVQHTTVSIISANGSDPIVLDLNGDGIHFTASDAGIDFDLNADGFAEALSWASPEDGTLVMDLDRSGAIENGTEVLSETFNGFGFGTSMEALRSLDTNVDGTVDAADARFADLQVWRDANGDGASQAGELLSLAEAGIVNISVQEQARNETIDGQQVYAAGTFTFADGATGDYVGVRLSAQELADVGNVADAATLGDPASAGGDIVEFQNLRRGGISYRNAIDGATSVWASLALFAGAMGEVPGDAVGQDAVIGAASLNGSNSNDQPVGFVDDQAFRDSQGSNHIVGGAGDDSISFRDAPSGVAVDLETGTVVNDGQNNADAGNPATVVNVEHVYATAHADTITGDGAANVFFGNAGDDHLKGRAGNDALVGDFGEANADGGFGGNDIIEGEGGDDLLAGGDGDDQLFGGEDDDVIAGGAGNDLIDGGAGSHDLAWYSADPDADGDGFGVTVDLSQNFAIDGHGDTDLLAGIEDVTGSSFDDLITGDAGVNELDGGGGNDLIQGAVGNDLIQGGGGLDRLVGGEGQDMLIGGLGDDALDGGLGDDVLAGGLGADVLAGGPGADSWKAAKAATPLCSTSPISASMSTPSPISIPTTRTEPMTCSISRASSTRPLSPPRPPKAPETSKASFRP